jgi:5-methylcytosine-specific restriction endonuclease McrA
MMSKQCRKCGEVKPLERFPIDKRNRDGRGGQCRPCKDQKTKEWQARNKEKVLEASRKWKARNPNWIQTYSATYWEENKERVALKRKEWMRSKPGQESYYRRIREARKRNAPGHHSSQQLQWRIEYYGGRCYMCRQPADTIDHVMPISQGGSNWPANLRPACRSCNSRKGISPLSV